MPQLARQVGCYDVVYGKQDCADNGTLICRKPVFNEKVAVPVT